MRRYTLTPLGWVVREDDQLSGPHATLDAARAAGKDTMRSTPRKPGAKAPRVKQPHKRQIRAARRAKFAAQGRDR